MSDDDVLDYEQLYQDYQTGLVDKLRGFGPASEALSLWVPDEDPLTSLRNMLDAAASVGQTVLRIRIGPSTLVSLDRARLAELAGHFGEAELAEQAESVVLQVIDLHEARGLAQTHSGREVRARAGSVEAASGLGHAVYARALQRAAASIRFEAERAEGDGTQLAHEVDGVRLSLVVNTPQDHRIVRARHSGARPDERALLDVFCALLEGHTMQEASDHSVLRLEFALREARDARPVAGIVTPESADPMFALPTALIRGALSSYRDAAGYRATHNFHDDRPGDPWQKADDVQRRAWLEKELSAVAREIGFEAGDVRVHDVQFDVRVVLEADGQLEGPERPRKLMLIERALKDRVDPRLEVFLEEVKDKNKLRRLAVVGG